MRLITNGPLGTSIRKARQRCWTGVMGWLLLGCAVTVFSALGTPLDYTQLLGAVKAYENGFSDQESLNQIFEAAKSDAPPAVVAHCMGVYTLHMGATGNAGVCLGGIQALYDRYPDSPVTTHLKDLYLFPSPCETCQDRGVVQMQKQGVCETCKSSGKCLKCGGYGEYKFCPFHRCNKIWLYSQLPPPPYDQYCQNCYNWTKYQRTAKTQPTLLVIKKCTDCSGTGKCPQCRGVTGTTTSTQRCPACNGAPKKINVALAKTELALLTRDLREGLQIAIHCEAAFTEALKFESVAERVVALKACLERYAGAFNIARVAEAHEHLVQAQTLLGQEQEKEMQRKALEERSLAEQRQQTLDQHQEFLRIIRETQSKAPALAELQKFMVENPGSPVIVEARLLAAELGQAIAAESNAKKRNRYITIGCGSFLGVAALAWLISCVNFTRPKPIVIQQHMPVSDEPPQRMPIRLASRAPHVPTLMPKRADTPFELGAYCPECEALLECPPDIRDMNVICSVCRKPFHVN